MDLLAENLKSTIAVLLSLLLCYNSVGMAAPFAHVETNSESGNSATTNANCFKNDSLQDLVCLKTAVDSTTNRILTFVASLSGQERRNFFSLCTRAFPNESILQLYNSLARAADLLEAVCDPLLPETNETLAWLDRILTPLNNSVQGFCQCESVTCPSEMETMEPFVGCEYGQEFKEICLLQTISTLVKTLNGRMTEAACSGSFQEVCTRTPPSVIQPVEDFRDSVTDLLSQYQLTQLPHYNLTSICSPSHPDSVPNATLYEGLCSSNTIINDTNTPPEITDLLTQLNTVVLPKLEDYWNIDCRCGDDCEVSNNVDLSSCLSSDQDEEALRTLCALVRINGNVQVAEGRLEWPTSFRDVQCS